MLTTHSMDEASALCERIAIQVDGSFRCLGTAQEIKDIHGSGYEVTLRFAPPPRGTSRSGWMKTQTALLHQWFEEYCRPFERLLSEDLFDADGEVRRVVRDAEVNGLNAMWVVNVPTESVAGLMRALEKRCTTPEVVDWYIAQVTLERVFNNFAMTSENAGLE